MNVLYTLLNLKILLLFMIIVGILIHKYNNNSTIAKIVLVDDLKLKTNRILNITLLFGINETNFKTIKELREIIKDVSSTSPLNFLVKIDDRLFLSSLQINNNYLPLTSNIKELIYILNDKKLKNKIKFDYYISDNEKLVLDKNKYKNEKISFFKPFKNISDVSYILIELNKK